MYVDNITSGCHTEGLVGNCSIREKGSQKCHTEIQFIDSHYVKLGETHAYICIFVKLL